MAICKSRQKGEVGMRDFFKTLRVQTLSLHFHYGDNYNPKALTTLITLNFVAKFRDFVMENLITN